MTDEFTDGFLQIGALVLLVPHISSLADLVQVGPSVLHILTSRPRTRSYKVENFCHILGENTVDHFEHSNDSKILCA